MCVCFVVSVVMFVFALRVSVCTCVHLCNHACFSVSHTSPGVSYGSGSLRVCFLERSACVCVTAQHRARAE